MNKKLLAVAIASAMAAPIGASAIEASVSGHVNRVILFADDGFDSDVMQADSSNSMSRFRITGSGDLGIGGMKVGVNLEASWASNRTSRVTIKARNGNGGAADLAFAIRHSNLWFSGGWGRLIMGHTSTAYDGITDSSQAGPQFLAGILNGSTMGGNIRYKRTGNVAVNNGLGNAASVGNSYVNFDGGRQDVLRYDTPNFGPLSARVSVSDNQTWGASAHLNAKFSGANIVIRGGYEDRENDREDIGAAGVSERWGVSGSVLFSQGTNITVAYSGGDFVNGNGSITNTYDQGDGNTIYALLGHRWGANTIAVNYGHHEFDGVAAAGTVDHDTTTWGIGFTHTLSEPRVELFAGYRNFDLDVQNVTGIEDVDLFQMGARVRF
ncbi:MAG: porin [Chromatiales bacterium]|jgi:hypothetical protein|nr:porin [Chromatiales bacterium]